MVTPQWPGQSPGQRNLQRLQQQQRQQRQRNQERMRQGAWWEEQQRKKGKRGKKGTLPPLPEHAQRRTGGDALWQDQSAPDDVEIYREVTGPYDEYGFFRRLIRGLLVLAFGLATVWAALVAVVSLLDGDTSTTVEAGAVAIVGLVMTNWIRGWGRRG